MTFPIAHPTANSNVLSAPFADPEWPYSVCLFVCLSVRPVHRLRDPRAVERSHALGPVYSGTIHPCPGRPAPYPVPSALPTLPTASPDGRHRPCDVIERVTDDVTERVTDDVTGQGTHLAAWLEPTEGSGTYISSE